MFPEEVKASSMVEGAFYFALFIRGPPTQRVASEVLQNN